MVFLVYLVKPRAVNPKNRVRFPKTPKTGKITVVVYPPWTREVAGNVIKSRHIIVSSSVLLKNAIAFFKTKCIENLSIKKLLDTIFNHKAIALLLKITRSDD